MVQLGVRIFFFFKITIGRTIFGFSSIGFFFISEFGCQNRAFYQWWLLHFQKISVATFISDFTYLKIYQLLNISGFYFKLFYQWIEYQWFRISEKLSVLIFNFSKIRITNQLHENLENENPLNWTSASINTKIHRSSTFLCAAATETSYL